MPAIAAEGLRKKSHTFDSFECGIESLAPRCDHGAHRSGQIQLRDRA
jgi:hypothetical protein